MVALYAGSDVSLELTSICVMDQEGRMVLEAKAAAEPDAIADALREAAGEFVRVGHEAGSLSQWLFFGLKDAGLPAVCLEARHAKAATVARDRRPRGRSL